MPLIRSTTRQSHWFYSGESVVLNFNVWSATGQPGTGSQAFTGNYYVRSYYGTLVTSGSLSAATSVNLGSGLPCGWYRIYLTQGTNDGTYGLSAGASHFCVVPTDAHFPTMVGVTPANAARRGHLGDDCYLHGVTLSGPRRNLIPDATNSAYLTEIQTGRTLDASWYDSIPDSVRPRPHFASFVQSVAGAQDTGATTFITDLFDNRGITYFEGPANEPTGNAATNATAMQAFYNKVKAVRPSAKAMGPCPVSVNYSLSQPGGYLPNIFANLAAMNPVPLDGITFHPYNCFNGDLTMGRKTLTDLVAILTTNGLQNLPRFNTEQGFWTLERGVFSPRLQARWTLQMYLLMEQFGIPKEHFAYFTDADTGDYTFPSEMSTGECNFLPVTAMIRTLSAEIWGKAFTAALDFGSPGNDMLLGSRYTNPNTGTQVLVFQSGGATDLTVKLTVTGASSLTVVDCFGNTSTVTVTSGVAQVPIALEPCYVRLPSGVTAVPVDLWSASVLGTDLALTATASASGSNSGAQANRMNSGSQLSSYYLNSQLVSASQSNAPYVDNTGSSPAWARLDWATNQTINRVHVFATPPWQAQGTLLDFDVQWLDADGSTWHTAQTITEQAKYGTVDDTTANVLGHVTHAVQGGCTVENYHSERWAFPVTFSQVTTKGIRVNIRSATYGMDPTLESFNAKFGDKTTFSNNFTIRALQAFNAAAEPSGITRYLVARTS